MNLLTSVQSVARKLRVDPPTGISTSDLLANTIVDFLNEATEEVLNTKKWSFLKYDDGQVFFPARFTATTGASMSAGSTSFSMNVLGANSFGASDVTDFTANRLLAHVRFTSDATQAQTSYPVSILQSAANFPGTLRNAFRGTGDAAAVELYAHSYALPVTVRQVLSVRHQQEPLHVEFVDRHTDIDDFAPRITDVFRDRPDVVYVGGAVETTLSAAGAAVVGEGLTVWPPPDSDLTVDYSYIKRFGKLSADTDTWDGVPAEVISVLEWVAYEKALDSDVGNDPQRASQLALKNAARIRMLERADEKAPLRRHIPSEIGSPRIHGRGSYARWASTTITGPS